MEELSTSRRGLPAWIWLGLPVGIVVAQFVLKAIDVELYRSWMRSEYGIVENLTVLSLFLSVVTAILLFRRRRHVRSRWFGPFALVMALGCLFFGGEEASWGQHWLGFEPPEDIRARNDQGEFNLHNDPVLETFLDQLPRSLLTLAALVGGVIAPLVRRKRGTTSIDFDTPSPFGWIWPTGAALPSALLAVTITLPEKIFEATMGDVPEMFEISAGETKEVCLALFLLVYLQTLYLALRGARTVPGTDSPPGSRDRR